MSKRKVYLPVGTKCCSSLHDAVGFRCPFLGRHTRTQELWCERWCVELKSEAYAALKCSECMDRKV